MPRAETLISARLFVGGCASEWEFRRASIATRRPRFGGPDVQAQRQASTFLHVLAECYLPHNHVSWMVGPYRLVNRPRFAGGQGDSRRGLSFPNAVRATTGRVRIPNSGGGHILRTDPVSRRPRSSVPHVRRHGSALDAGSANHAGIRLLGRTREFPATGAMSACSSSRLWRSPRC